MITSVFEMNDQLVSSIVTLFAITALLGISNFPDLASIVTFPFKKEKYDMKVKVKHKQFH